MKSHLKNIPASVLSRPLHLSRKNKEDYNSNLVRYVAERFLYRPGQSEYKDKFILKGAYLLTITLNSQTYRTTKDIDFLKTGESNSDNLKAILIEICLLEDPTDGVMFDIDSITLKDIHEQNKYQGQRAKIITHIGNARIPLQIDIGI